MILAVNLLLWALVAALAVTAATRGVPAWLHHRSNPVSALPVTSWKQAKKSSMVAASPSWRSK